MTRPAKIEKRHYFYVPIFPRSENDTISMSLFFLLVDDDAEVG